MLEPLRAALARLAFDGLGDPVGREALAQLAARLEREAHAVPRAGVLAEALRRLLAQPPSGGAPRLLKLLVAVERLGSDAAPVPLPEPGAPLATPPDRAVPSALPPLELAQLRAALSRRTTPPAAVLERLADPTTGEDPRVWPLLEEGLAHPFLRDACAALIPRLGADWEPRLLAAFDRRGAATESARLRAISTIMGPRALPLLRTCARRGSRHVRDEAMEGLLRQAPEEASHLLCEQFDGAPDAPEALLGRLAATGLEPALLRLIRWLEGGGVLAPRAFLRLPAEAMSTWLALAESEAPALTDTAEFFELLEHHPAPSAKAFLHARTCHPEPAVRRRAAQALLSGADPALLAELSSRGEIDPALEAIGVAASFSLGPAHAFDALAPRLAALTSSAGGRTTAPPDSVLPQWLTLTLQLLTPLSDPRWRAALQPLADGGHPVILHALRQLGPVSEDPRAGSGASSPGPAPQGAAASQTAREGREVQCEDGPLRAGGKRERKAL